MSEGLQRRRRAGNDSGSGVAAGAGSQLGSNAGVTKAGTILGHAANLASLDDKQPMLTLMEEVLLLGLKDKEGYLSFWNDSISYVLRGCILIELALRGRIAMIADSSRKRLQLPDRLIEVVNESLTGEVLLDETLKLMKSSEPLSIACWVDYLSGETWNFAKVSYQLKEVRERLSKGLVDKGILRTDKRNFFLFDMATHPLADQAAKDDIRRRVLSVVTENSMNVRDSRYMPTTVPFRSLRAICLTTSCFAANVLENVTSSLSYDSIDATTLRADEMLADYSEYPFEKRKAAWSASFAQAVDEELAITGESGGLYMEIIAAVNKIYSQLDSVV